MDNTIDIWMTILDYYTAGEDPGNLGQALLLLDFNLAKKKAYQKLNDNNINDLLVEIQKTLPIVCYGDKKSIKKWIEHGGLVGIWEKDETDLLLAVKLGAN